MSKEELESLGYKIENVQIKGFDLIIDDYHLPILLISVQGDGWSSVYKAYLDEGGTERGLEYIIRILDVAEVSKLSSLKGKHMRVAIKKPENSISIIGHIVEDRWFDPEEFIREEREDAGEALS